MVGWMRQWLLLSSFPEVTAVLRDSDDRSPQPCSHPSSCSRLAALGSAAELCSVISPGAWAQAGPFLSVLVLGGDGNIWLGKYFHTASPSGLLGRACGQAGLLDHQGTLGRCGRRCLRMLCSALRESPPRGAAFPSCLPLTLLLSPSLRSVPCKPGDAPHLAAFAHSNGILFSTTSLSVTRAEPGSRQRSAAARSAATRNAVGAAPAPAGCPPRTLPLLPFTQYFQDVSWGLGF